MTVLRFHETRSLPLHALLVLAGIAVVFLAVRVPLMYRQYGGVDEDVFSVPGWTVAREGIPRIPYVPSRDPGSVFYRADEALFTLPPAYFYWQAPFFLVLPDGHGTARLASGVAGLLAVLLVYRLGNAFYQDETAGLWAAALYSVSRAFYFPATSARPDMLCGAVGIAALLATWHWQTSGRRRFLVIAGALLGLGALTHPFALVFALQVGVWVFIASRGFRGRFGAVAILATSTLAVLALWLPLILAYPDLFRRQFLANVIDQSGPGLLSRLVFPWESLAHQAKILWQHLQPPQTGLALLGLAGATWTDLRRREPGPTVALVLAWSSVYLLATCSGIHPTKGYWCYPAALVFICLGRTVAVFSEWARRSVPQYLWWTAAGAFFLLSMLPGFGIRTWVAHLRHWSDTEYNAPRFVEMMLCDLPRDARLTVDPEYAFDVYLAGRPTILALTSDFFFQAADFPYNYLIAGRNGLQNHAPERLDGEFLRAYGDRDAVFACYAEIYTPRGASAEKHGTYRTYETHTAYGSYTSREPHRDRDHLHATRTP